jgi:hypothetical protein
MMRNESVMREAVGAFHDPEDFQAAIDDLLSSGSTGPTELPRQPDGRGRKARPRLQCSFGSRRWKGSIP